MRGIRSIHPRASCVLHRLVDATDDRTVADAHEDRVGSFPPQVFENLEACGLLPLGHERVVSGIAVVPAVLGRCLHAEVKRIAVVAVHERDG